MTKEEAADAVRLMFGSTYWTAESGKFKLVVYGKPTRAGESRPLTETAGMGLTWEQAIAAAETTRALDALDGSSEPRF